MAGDWIPVRARLRDEPEVIAIAQITGRSIHEVMGLLIDLWGWASEVSEEGKILSRSCPDLVPVLSRVIGGDAKFWSSVEAQGWLNMNSGISIPRWERWLSRSAKTRLNERRKKQLQRKSYANPGHEICPASVPLQSGHDRDYRTGQDRTEQDARTHPDARARAIASPLPDPESLSAAWRRVVQQLPKHDSKIKNPAGYVARVRRDNPGKLPQECPGFEWYASACAKAEQPTEAQLLAEYMDELNANKRKDAGQA